jgi:predicted HAD superfamily hydrolase
MNSSIASVVSDIGNLEKTFSTSNNLYELEQAEQYAKILYQTIKKRIDLNTIKILSFDVFDTLLLRNSKYEPHRYLEMSEKIVFFLIDKGINNFSIWDIYSARITAFRVCYRTVKQNCKIREGKLIDVLSLMVQILNLEKWVIPELIKIELAYELENLKVNPLLKSFLAISEIQQKQIIFISDMYMSGQHIYQLFKQYYPDLELASYYSSADYGITKLSGLLYGLVAQDLGVDCSQILHMGDNLQGDVQQAKKRGVNAIHLPIPEIYLKERRQEKEKFKADLIAQKFHLI